MKIEDLKIGQNLFTLKFNFLAFDVDDKDINVCISKLKPCNYINITMDKGGVEVCLQENEHSKYAEYRETIDNFSKEVFTNLTDIVKVVGEKYHILNKQRAGRGNDAVAFNILKVGDPVYIAKRHCGDVDFYSTKVSEVIEITNKKGVEKKYRLEFDDDGLFLASNGNKFDDVENDFRTFEEGFISPDIYAAFEAFQKFIKKEYKQTKMKLLVPAV